MKRIKQTKGGNPSGVSGKPVEYPVQEKTVVKLVDVREDAGEGHRRCGRSGGGTRRDHCGDLGELGEVASQGETIVGICQSRGVVAGGVLEVGVGKVDFPGPESFTHEEAVV